MTTQMSELARTYRPQDVEPEVLERWLESRAYHADPHAEGEPYSIVIPPPNVTAALHLGHALNNTLQDVLTRYQRMRGRNALWMPGTDHAGIATQTVVEKRVQQEEGKRRVDFEREAFVEKIQTWKDEYERRITDQLKQMGCSCDWDRQRFTMDEVCAAAVREAFFRLFKDGLIYRGKRLVNWDPVTQTALADDEVEMKEVDGQFWYMRYPLVEPVVFEGRRIEFVTVATTRPETMLGDTAVAVNPKDPRAGALRGAKVRVPIVNRVVPVIEDEHVVLPDAEGDERAKYSSGFLKVTPAHDPNDYEIGQRHWEAIADVVGADRVLINVMGPDASISKNHGWADEDFERADAFLKDELLGLSREAARKAIVRWFKQQDLLEDQRPYRHAVGHSYRSHVPVEPYLSDQWYVAVTKQIQRLPDDGLMFGTEVPANSLAGLALRAMAADQRVGADPGDSSTVPAPFSEASVRPGEKDDGTRLRVGEKPWEGHLRFYPGRYARTFQQWHENIRDWCISRQLWWGHRIPVWKFVDDGAVDGKSDARLKTLIEALVRLQREERIIMQHTEVLPEGQQNQIDLEHSFVCVRQEGDAEAIETLRELGFAQDEDVLDTWFSSALWPLSTMGWPNPEAFPEQIPEGEAVLAKWNPTNTLCTAREIITLWVSRMVMFNLYFSDPDLDGRSEHQRLPFYDVFVHAMIQDGHGQKMSKSLGNGVDPMDIIHSHGSDAMRFTLAAMTTHTQDVRMPVDLICPYTGETIEPKYITSPGGYKVMAPVQGCPSDPSKQMVTSYGVASGQAEPTDQTPLARNTSNKFDQGRNFANKLWNAVRFALGNLEEAGGRGESALVGEGATEELTLPDRWILSRLVAVAQESHQALKDYEFSQYAQGLYDFFWRDLCDWYIEAAKPTVQENAAQRAVLAACIDASLRMLHPVMPFITEKLWSHLNAVVPERSFAGVELPGGDLLMIARWPKLSRGWADEEVERTFGLLQDVVGGIRQVRTQHQVPPRQTVDLSADAPAAIAQTLLRYQGLVNVLGNVQCREMGPRVEKPGDAAVAVTGDVELYLHGLVDPDKERERLEKRKAELEKQIKTLSGRLSNESYVNKAPAKLVEESREQLSAAERELEAVEGQLGAL